MLVVVDFLAKTGQHFEVKMYDKKNSSLNNT